LAGFDWVKCAQSVLENMGDPNSIFEMPLCRFVALYIAAPPNANASEDLTTVRNRIRARKGLPLIARKGK